MKMLKKYWWIFLVVLLVFFRKTLFKKSIILQKGDNNNDVKKYQTILSQLIQMTVDNDFNSNEAINKVYAFEDDYEKDAIANGWTYYPSLAVNGIFDDKTEYIGMKFKSLYDIPGLANFVDLNLVIDWFEKQNSSTLEQQLK